jgi:hypothetical protein
MAVSGLRCVEYRGSGEPMSYASREQNYENLPAPRAPQAAPDRYLLTISFIGRQNRSPP